MPGWSGGVLRAVILAAGEGRRMRPLTETRPKALVELAGGALIDHVVIALRDAGVRDIAVVVGHMAEPLVAHLERSKRGPFTVLRQDRPLGTGDALRAAAAWLDGELLVVNGDVLAHAKDIRAVADFKAKDAVVTMLTAEVADATRYGVVLTEGRLEGRVKAIIEKPEHPPSRRVNAGVYKVGPELAAELSRMEPSARGEFELTSAVAALVDKGQVFAVPAAHPWTEVGRPWDLLLAQERLMADLEGRNDGEVEHGAVLRGEVQVGKGAIVKAGAYIEGPVVIGADSRIGPNCYIRGATHIGAGCHVGAATEIKNSILCSHSNAPHQNYIGDSIVGSQVNLGAGTKIANLRLDEREVSVQVGGAVVSTGRRKFGAVLGDGVKTGINASINAGTIVGPSAFIGPGARASGTIEAGARVM